MIGVDAKATVLLFFCFVCVPIERGGKRVKHTGGSCGDTRISKTNRVVAAGRLALWAL